MPIPNETQQKEQLFELMREILSRDETLRDAFQVGDKFRFIRDRLRALSIKVEDALREIQAESIAASPLLSEDEVLVYIYLYNAQGLVFQTWQKMLNPAVFYEFSVNRPAYIDKNHVDQFIRSKTNKAQHGYLTIAVKKQAVSALESAKDSLDQPLVKVKEGALLFNRLFSFTHNEKEFSVNDQGVATPKSNHSGSH